MLQKRPIAVEAVADGPAVHLIELDLGVPDSVRACVATFLELRLPFDTLINNAGINAVKTWRKFTPGIESQFAINYVGHFMLTKLFDEKLCGTPGAHVVIVASESHRRVLAVDADKVSRNRESLCSRESGFLHERPMGHAPTIVTNVKGLQT